MKLNEGMALMVVVWRKIKYNYVNLWEFYYYTSYSVAIYKSGLCEERGRNRQRE